MILCRCVDRSLVSHTLKVASWAEEVGLSGVDRAPNALSTPYRAVITRFISTTPIGFRSTGINRRSDG